MIDVLHLDTDDVDRLADAEMQFNPSPWSRSELLTHLTHGQPNGMCVERDGKLAGYPLYKTEKHQFEIHHLFVLPDYRGAGIATALVNMLKRLLSQEDFSTLAVDLDEHSVGLQLFFQANGFIAERTFHGAGSVNGDSDVYQMRYHRPRPA